MEGAHPPTPSSLAPSSSQRHVVCFRAPHRLPARLKNHILLATARNSRKIIV